MPNKEGKFPVVCWFCKYIDYDGGEKWYSNETPGCDAYICCKKGHWWFKPYDVTLNMLREYFLEAQTCPDFEMITNIEEEVNMNEEKTNVQTVPDIQNEFTIAYLKNKNQNLAEWVNKYPRYNPESLMTMFQNVIKYVEEHARAKTSSSQMGTCSVIRILTKGFWFRKHIVLDTHYGIIVVFCPRSKQWTCYKMTAPEQWGKRVECFDCHDKLMNK